MPSLATSDIFLQNLKVTVIFFREKYIHKQILSSMSMSLEHFKFPVFYHKIYFITSLILQCLLQQNSPPGLLFINICCTKFLYD